MTEKDLDKLFKDKLSANAHQYPQGAWERFEQQFTVNQSVDELFKSGLAGHAHPYNPSAWAAAEKLIIANERAAFIKKAAAFTAIAASILGMLWFTIFDAQELNNQPKAKNLTQQTKSSLNQQTQELLSANSDQKDKNTANNTAAHEAVNEQSAASEAQIEKASISTSSATIHNDNSDKTATLDNKAELALTKADKPIKADKSANNSGIKTKANSPLTPELQPSKTKVAENRVKNLSAPSATIANSNDAALPEADLAYMSLASIPTLKSAVGSSLPLVKRLKPSKAKYWSVELNAGLNLAQPYYGGADIKPRTTPLYLFGLGINRNFKSKLSLESGIFYYARTGGSVSINKEVVEYGLGVNETQYELKGTQLHYFGVPLIINWAILDRHTIGIGGQFALLVNTKSTLETTSLSDGLIVNQSTSEGWGYLNGFARSDAALVMNYHYQLTDRFKIGLGLNYGLVDITPDDLYGNSFHDRNLQMMVRVKYSVLDF